MAFHDFGAGLMLEVSGGSASRNAVMLPFTDEAVPEVDVDGGRIVVDPPAGVLAGGEAKEAQE
jgi:16S rRNA processing protein RimM